jgi:adenosylcobyric acid synthase
MRARPIFIGGTGSHAGKSWVATALCRYLYRMGRRVAPFKAQNMSNNSMVCAGGGEIGRAQAAQAEACGLEPHPDMNPILLKPTGTLGSQVVLNGRPWRNLKAADYYCHFEFLLENVLASYFRLAAKYDTIVIEGAGSVTELNLARWDLVNLGLAKRLAAPAILVADIDRGGVFASVVGTFHLLDDADARLVRSFLINRFRGDRGLFEDGVGILEEKTRRRCLGVFPFAHDIHLDAEDSVSIDDLQARTCVASDQRAQGCRVAIIRLPHISNFTDFRLMPFAVYLTAPSSEQFDFILLPGTKSTIEDLLWMRSNGMEQWLLQQVERGARVMGVCGGFQMLGEEIVDPHGVESPVYEIRGIGLIPAKTRLSRDKITRTVEARTPSDIPFEGYEIHMGITVTAETNRPFATLADGTLDGVRLPHVIGTYLHGALENKAVLEEILGRALPATSISSKEAAYDRLAGWFAEHVNHDVLLNEYLEPKVAGSLV